MTARVQNRLVAHDSLGAVTPSGGPTMTGRRANMMTSYSFFPLSLSFAPHSEFSSDFFFFIYKLIYIVEKTHNAYTTI